MLELSKRGGLEMKAQTVLDFWFKELTPQQHFEKNEALDTEIRTRFLAIHQQVAKGETFEWRQTAQGRLAEIIVLDQFSRNMFRGTAQSFAFDILALILAQEAVLCGADQELSVEERAFIYMPYMHSESEVIHKEAVRLFDQPGLEFSLDYEHRHFDIIKQFGRYPHRNMILNRTSTEAEKQFLLQPNSSF